MAKKLHKSKKKTTDDRRKVRVSMTLVPGLVKRLDSMAKATRRSRSAVAEELLTDVLGDQEVFVKALGDPVVREFMGRMFGDRDLLKRMAKAVGDEVTDAQMALFSRKMVEVLK